MAGPSIQNFAVPAGDSMDLNFDVDPDDGVSLVGATTVWSAFKMKFAARDGDPVIKKTTNYGLDITTPSELKFTVSLDRGDTLALLGNYYHEAKIVDADGNHVTVTVGVMTVTGSQITDVTSGEIP